LFFFFFIIFSVYRVQNEYQTEELIFYTIKEPKLNTVESEEDAMETDWGREDGGANEREDDEEVEGSRGQRQSRRSRLNQIHLNSSLCLMIIK
jgi:hypothetical protein